MDPVLSLPAARLQTQCAQLPPTGQPQYASNEACRARASVLQLPPRGARRELRRGFGRVDAKTANQDLGGGVEGRDVSALLGLYTWSVACGLVGGEPS